MSCLSSLGFILFYHCVFSWEVLTDKVEYCIRVFSAQTNMDKFQIGQCPFAILGTVSELSYTGLWNRQCQLLIDYSIVIQQIFTELLLYKFCNMGLQGPHPYRRKCLLKPSAGVSCFHMQLSGCLHCHWLCKLCFILYLRNKKKKNGSFISTNIESIWLSRNS